MSERVIWVDTAKGFAIISVVLGHSSLPIELRSVVYSFHMPLFFMLSGVFLFNSCIQNQWADFLKKKAKGLLVAYVVFNFILIIFYGGLAKLSGQLTDSKVSYDWLSHLIGIFVGFRGDYPFSSYLWFLPCLFLAECILYPFARRGRNVYLCAAVLFSILGVLINFYIGAPLPMSLDNAFLATGFLALGILLDSKYFSSYTYVFVILTFYVFCTYINMQNTNGLGVDLFEVRMGNY